MTRREKATQVRDFYMILNGRTIQGVANRFKMEQNHVASILHLFNINYGGQDPRNPNGFDLAIYRPPTNEEIDSLSFLDNYPDSNF